jgi:hypothetical protein
MGVEQEELVDDLLAAPVGVTLLAALEAERRPPSLDAPQDCDPRAVDEAVAMVERMPFGAPGQRMGAVPGPGLPLAHPGHPDEPRVGAPAPG